MLLILEKDILVKRSIQFFIYYGAKGKMRFLSIVIIIYLYLILSTDIFYLFEH